MNKKLFLTSAIALGFTCPAIAEPTNTGNFPNDGLMQADYTYTNAATSTNMDGVYEGTVNAEAQYENILYRLAAGRYLPANSETDATCDQNGYFCAGDDNGVYYSSSAQGLTQCPSGYGNTANGASANTDCYRTCTNNDVAHSTGTVNGGYYYGDNNQCEPTNCVNGWHVKPALPDLNTLIDDIQAEEYSSVGLTGGDPNGNAEQYGLDTTNDRGRFVIDYGDKGLITGSVQCSTQSGQNNIWEGITNEPQVTQVSSLQDNTGNNCWCKIDGYVPYGGQKQTFSAPWVFYQEMNVGGRQPGCAAMCAENCSGSLEEAEVLNLVFRSVMFNSIGTPGPAMCEANTITINWNGTTQEAINANNAGTATYGSDVRTPQSASHVPGKTFTGWRFSAPTPVQSGN